MNAELEKYFKEHNYSLYSTAEDSDSYYNPSEEIHEYAKYEYRKLIDTDKEGISYYENALIRIDKSTFFGHNPHFFYTIYISKAGPYFGTGHGTFEEVLKHNQKLTIEHIETIRKLFDIPYESN